MRVPLLARDGSVVGVTLVDDDDAPLLGDRPWRKVVAGRYAGRAATIEERTVDGVRGPTRTIYLHRHILTAPPGVEVDHINRNPFDNRRANLRLVTHQENIQNHPGYGGTSQHRGVYWHKLAKKWAVTVCVDGRNNYLGVYADEAEAAEVALSGRRRLMAGAVD